MNVPAGGRRHDVTVSSRTRGLRDP
eukprot:SAG11_NODE_32040_length_287_cov_0.356383_1_plen_24_part_10